MKLSRGAEHVRVCYILDGIHCIKVLAREDAYRLRKFLKNNDGTIYWFNAA
jgi:hypothetical protein